MIKQRYFQSSSLLGFNIFNSIKSKEMGLLSKFYGYEYVLYIMNKKQYTFGKPGVSLDQNELCLHFGLFLP